MWAGPKATCRDVSGGVGGAKGNVQGSFWRWGRGQRQRVGKFLEVGAGPKATSSEVSGGGGGAKGNMEEVSGGGGGAMDSM